MNKVEHFRVAGSPFKTRYDNFIGGRFVAPRAGRYFDNTSPVTGQVLCQIARSDASVTLASLTPIGAPPREQPRSRITAKSLRITAPPSTSEFAKQPIQMIDR